MNLRHYVPILKWKTGEKIALKQLSTEHKSRIRPLVEVVDLLDPAELTRDLGECFGHTVYVDTINVDAGDRKLIVDISEGVFCKFFFPVFANIFCSSTPREIYV